MGATIKQAGDDVMLKRTKEEDFMKARIPWLEMLALVIGGISVTFFGIIPAVEGIWSWSSYGIQLVAGLVIWLLLSRLSVAIQEAKEQRRQNE